MAPFIRRAFVEYAKGTYTYQSLADFLAARGMRTPGGKRPSAQLMHKTLTNAAYAGVIKAWGERHEGQFEALVPWALFEQCQPGRRRITASSGTIVRSRYNATFPLRGVICGECGRRLTGSFSRSGSSAHKRYPYYHHQRQGCRLATFLPKDSFERQFTNYLEEIALNRRFEKLFTALVQSIWKQAAATRDSERLRIEREITSVTQQRQQVFELHRAGTYTVTEFLEQKALLSDRLTELQRQHGDLATTDFPLDQAVGYCLQLGRETAATWKRLDPMAQHQFQALVFADGEIRYDEKGFWNSPLTAIYLLNREIGKGDSTKVDLRGDSWDSQLRDELEHWLQFGQGLPREEESERIAA